jgi:DNA-binding transcriptional LysR family regulator
MLLCRFTIERNHLRIHHRQIEAFRFVFQTGSNTTAAELMGVSQPAVSRLIRDFEAEVGFELFTRARGRLNPTSNAIELHREVERSFTGLERIAQAAGRLKGRQIGDLRIAATISPCLYLFPPVFQRYRQEWPDVQISLNSFASPVVLDLVARQQFDIGVATVSGDAPGLEQIDLPVMSAVCVLPKSHELAERDVIQPSDLDGEPLLMISDYSPTQRRVTQSLTAAGIELNVIFEASVSTIICDLVDRGIGISIIEPLTALAYRGANTVVRPYEPGIPVSLKAVHSSAHPLPERAATFVELMKVELKQLEVVE